MQQDESDFLKVAKQAAIEASKVILKHYGHKQKLMQKGIKHDFAVQTDLDAEETIIKLITDNFPVHNIISEEKGRVERGSEYSWVIDPLDGTIAFVSNLPFFAVSIGLLKNNKPIVGVIMDVVRGELYFAQKGKGAFVNGNKIKVSKTSKLINAVIGVDQGKVKYRQFKLDTYFLPLIHKIRYCCNLGDVTHLAFLARGILDAMVDQAYLWDFAAGAVIVEEAGGRVTDRAGRDVDWSKERIEVVASNGLLHEQILEAVSSKL